MIERLTKYYNACHCVKQSLVFELTHDKNMDWCLIIYHRDSNTYIFESNGASLNLLCAEAYISLEKWAGEYSDLEDIENNL